ncbi:MAG: helix-turn-helix transcriptional regulator [Planctomycetota bacterium]|jgi:AraC-like DNA-binding protein
MSEQLHLSEGHFHRLVKHLEGCTPLAKLQGIRMEQAMGLLRGTTLPLDAIAARIGYSTAYAFSNAFHNHTGIRPGRYRKG